MSKDVDQPPQQEEDGLTYAEALLLRRQLLETRGINHVHDLVAMPIEEVLQQSAQWQQDRALLERINEALNNPDKKRQWMRETGVQVYDNPAPAPRPILTGDAFVEELGRQRRAWSESLDGPKFRGYGGACSHPEHRVGLRRSQADMDGHYAMGGGNPEWQLKHALRQPDITTNDESKDGAALVDKINGGWGGINR